MRGSRTRTTRGPGAWLLAGLLLPGLGPGLGAGAWTLAEAAAYQETSVERGGAVSGTVTFRGSPPPPDRRPVTRDQQACGTEPKLSDALLVSPAGGVRNVVAYLDGLTRGKPFPAVSAELDQRGCWFHPHVLLVRAGRPFALLNHDGILHNFRTPGTAANPAINKAQPRFKKRLEIRIDHPDIIPVNCDVHEWMRAVVVVMAHPYYALTDEEGRFTLGDVPPGRYTLVLWHEVLGRQTQELTVPPGGEARVAVEFPGR